MNEFVEAAKKKAAEKKELRNKMRDEAMKFVDEYKKENGNKSFISLRIRDGYIGKELGGGKLQMERSRPRGTLVAIKGENGQVHVGFTYLSNKDEDIPIVGIAQALKEAILEKEKENEQDDSCPDCLCEDCDKYCISKELGISKVIKSRDVELLNFFTIRAKCFFYPELYSYSRGTEKIEYPKYDLIHSNRKKVLDFLGKSES